ncbi:Sugar transporter [Neofusicoccum parvum]|uniref:Sugar transporter n=1 Tax=Neofusicoccum parvum TaxID=310453 RepID=A0ACB5RQ35_9PEZI|nr:Sugar transporter [Neofusicoccum parvum]
MFELKGRWLNWAITAASCQGFLLLGYDQGVMSGIIGAENQFGKDFNSPDANMQGLIVSIYDIGCAFGSLVSFFFAEKLGRKNMIIAGGSTMIIGTIILTSSTTIAQLLVGRVVTGVTVDRFGRRALLMFSATGLCLCFSLASILLSTGKQSNAYGATAMVFLFQIFLGIGWLPIPWFYPSEVTTTRIRSKGQALGSFINITPIATQNIQWRTFVIFAVFCALWVPIVYCFFPETNGLELEDLDYLFVKGGFTGGVWSSKGGRTVQKRKGREEAGVETGLKDPDRAMSEVKEDGKI